jgi:hypothetical protein
LVGDGCGSFEVEVEKTWWSWIRLDEVGEDLMKL